MNAGVVQLVRAPACHAGSWGFKSPLSRFLILVLLVGCNPTSQVEWRFEGEAATKELVSQLEKVESLEDLQREAPKIKKSIGKIVDLAIAAKKYQISHPDMLEASFDSTHISDLLKNEISRLYQIDGATGIMEELERDSLHRLDQFSKRLQSKGS